MVINVSEGLDSDTAQMVAIERATGSFVNGIYEKGLPTIFNSLISVQQPTPQQLSTLKEGERDKNPMLFISKKLLRTTNDKDGVLADTVIHNGIRFKIIAIGNWESYGFTNAFGVRD